MTTTTTTSPPKWAPKKGLTPQQPEPTATNSLPPRALSISSGIRRAAQKIVIYGPGGVGKTELASLLGLVGIQPAFIDIEEGSSELDVSRIDPTPETFEELREAIAVATDTADVGAIVVDTFTKANEFSVDFTLRTVKHEKGLRVTSIEGYGFGKGYVHNFESFLLILQALDAAARAGKHIVGICHDVTEKIPNPGGEDWLQYQPDLQSPPKHGKIRERVKNWCDHLLYIGFDTFVNADGKAQGSGSRTIYTTELPTHWAKSRSLAEPVPYEKGKATIWQQVFRKG